MQAVLPPLQPPLVDPNSPPGSLMYLLRHGQSYFNLHFSETHRDPGIEDPELTPLGVTQAKTAAATLSTVALTRLIVSPYTRALQTAAAILATRQLQVDIRHEVRERAAFVCDIGSSPDALALRFPRHSFGHLPSKWWQDAVESAAATEARAREFRRSVAGDGQAATTLLVSHWAFILALTGIPLNNGELMEYDPTMPAPERIAWQ